MTWAMVNPNYGHALADGHVTATQAPGGSWTVTIGTQGHGSWAESNDGTLPPFWIAYGPDRDEVRRLTQEWVTSAATLVGSYNRFRLVPVNSTTPKEKQ